LALDAKSTLEKAREFANLKRYARSTRKTYLAWISRFLHWLRQSGINRKPTEADIKGFLTHLAMEKRCSASTQNQAFSALLFLCRNVINVDLHDMAKNVRAKQYKPLPTVLSPDEVKRIIDNVEPKYRLMVRLLYGTGMRKMECVADRPVKPVVSRRPMPTSGPYCSSTVTVDIRREQYSTIPRHYRDSTPGDASSKLDLACGCVSGDDILACPQTVEASRTNRSLSDIDEELD